MRFILALALTVLKVLVLGAVAGLVLAQIPELRYDLGPKTPMAISSPRDLTPALHSRVTFAAVRGRAGFDKAFVYKTHGLAGTYFLVEPYGRRLVVRTFERVVDETGGVPDEWRRVERFVGKLRRFGRMPFSRSVRGGFRQQYNVEIPRDAFFLALDDVPRLSGWQVTAVIVATIMWVGLFYLFFLYPRRARRPADSTSGEAPE